jgi:hypothetical protein
MQLLTEGHKQPGPEKLFSSLTLNVFIRTPAEPARRMQHLDRRGSACAAPPQRFFELTVDDPDG